MLVRTAELICLFSADKLLIMTVHPNSLANLAKSTPFKTGDEWTGNRLGKPKGAHNRATIVRQLMGIKARSLNRQDINDLIAEYNLPEDVTLEGVLHAKQIALMVSERGDVAQRAIDSIKDDLYGKQTQTNVNVNAEMDEIDGEAMQKRLDELKKQYESEF